MKDLNINPWTAVIAGVALIGSLFALSKFRGDIIIDRNNGGQTTGADTLEMDGVNVTGRIEEKHETDRAVQRKYKDVGAGSMKYEKVAPPSQQPKTDLFADKDKAKKKQEKEKLEAKSGDKLEKKDEQGQHTVMPSKS